MIEALGTGVGTFLGGTLGQVSDALSAPRRYAWNALGLPEEGAELVANLTGMDRSSALAQALGLGAEILGDPLTYAGSVLGGVGGRVARMPWNAESNLARKLASLEAAGASADDALRSATKSIDSAIGRSAPGVPSSLVAEEATRLGQRLPITSMASGTVETVPIGPRAGLKSLADAEMAQAKGLGYLDPSEEVFHQFGNYRHVNRNLAAQGANIAENGSMAAAMPARSSPRNIGSDSFPDLGYGVRDVLHQRYGGEGLPVLRDLMNAGDGKSLLNASAISGRQAGFLNHDAAIEKILRGNLNLPTQNAPLASVLPPEIAGQIPQDLLQMGVRGAAREIPDRMNALQRMLAQYQFNDADLYKVLGAGVLTAGAAPLLWN